MGDNNSLINLGDLSGAAKVLVEKISDAIGAIYLPTQIKRVAAAEAEAEKIKAIAQTEISEIQQRALARVLYQEERKQENVEAISKLAIENLSPDAHPENIDPDWLSNFFDKCHFVSDTDMRIIWGKILAGEASNPGMFSKRTVALVGGLDKADAELFTQLCKFSWMVGMPSPLVFNEQDAIYTSKGINFDALTHLQSIGLLTFSNLTGFARQKLPKQFLTIYFGKRVVIEFPGSEDNQLSIGKILLTQAGQQLLSISGALPDEDFSAYVIKQWVDAGVTAYSPYP
jgi:hypothetical protein